MASALLAAAVPIVLLFKSLLAAGVKLPTASDLLGVHDGGAILPGFGPPTESGVREIPDVRPDGPSPSNPALARRLLEALCDSL